jgi:hypothetical protein
MPDGSSDTPVGPVAEDIVLERRGWVFERVGWALMAIILLAAVLGLFGPGVLGPARAQSNDGMLGFEYHRFWRAQSPMQIRVTVRREAAQDGIVRLDLSRAFLDRVRVEQVVPATRREEVSGEFVTYDVAIAPEDSVSTILIHLMATRFGTVRGSVGLHGGDAVAFRQFIHP